MKFIQKNNWEPNKFTMIMFRVIIESLKEMIAGFIKISLQVTLLVYTFVEL